MLCSRVVPIYSLKPFTGFLNIWNSLPEMFLLRSHISGVLQLPHVSTEFPSPTSIDQNVSRKYGSLERDNSKLLLYGNNGSVEETGTRYMVHETNRSTTRWTERVTVGPISEWWIRKHLLKEVTDWKPRKKDRQSTRRKNFLNFKREIGTKESDGPISNHVCNKTHIMGLGCLHCTFS